MPLVGGERGVRAGRRFALRIPLLPYEAIEPGGGELSELRARLAALLDRPEVAEAFFLGSRDLHGSIAAWRAAPDGELGYRLEWSLAKYVTRMASCPIPFGAFAGVATGEIDPDAGALRWFRLGAAAAHERRTRIHGDVLCRLLAELPAIPAVRRRLRFRTNSSASIAAGRLTYFQVRGRPDRRLDEYALVCVELTPHLDWVVEEARRGARLDALASALRQRDPDVTPADADAYIEQLASAQILVPELGPQVTGVEPMEGALHELGDAGLDEAARVLEAIREELGAIDAAGLARPVSSYGAAIALLNQLWRMTSGPTADRPGDLDARRLFHLDVTMTAEERPILGADVLRDVERTVELLRRIAPRREDPALSEFRDALALRWADGDVPLLEALDDELGLGLLFRGERRPGEGDTSREALSSPAIEEPVMEEQAMEEQAVTSGDRRAASLLQMWRRARAERAREIAVGPEELATLAGDADPGRAARLPDAFGVTVRLGLRGEERQLWLQGVTAPSAVRSLGRLCHADSSIEAMVRDQVRGERAAWSAAVLAEVAHLPEGRSADALFRPVLRDAEIVYLGRSGAPREQAIDARDLTVSAREGRVTLRSRRLGREVLPRLTSAHQLARSQFPVCRFLAALQAQDADPIGWSWGPLERLAWLPRVRLGDVVVAREQWRLGQDDLVRLGHAWGERDVVARRRRVAAEVDELRARRSLPRQVILVEADGDGDNGELIDFEHALLVQVFAGEVMVRGARVLTEVYPEPSASIVRGPEGHHASELFVSFVREPEG